jgi:hypothetical protein
MTAIKQQEHAQDETIIRACAATAFNPKFITFIELNGGDGEVLMSNVCTGCLIKNVAVDPLDYGQSTIRNISLTISVDNCSFFNADGTQVDDVLSSSLLSLWT